MPWLGLDIGGANLKAAHTNGTARNVPFPLWKAPGELANQLSHLLLSLPPANHLAVTMTGELCDCFPTKRDGVNAILHAVQEAAGERAVQVWTTKACFVTLAQAREFPLEIAAANWLALANVAAELAPSESGLLIDMGSTTTDIIPFRQGRAIPQGLTDPVRLRTGELVYTGARRTPLCALLGLTAAAEWFATMLDACLMLNLVPESPEDRDTADGRPATREHAHARLARMLCADTDTCSEEETQQLAERALAIQAEYVAAAVERVARAQPELPSVIVLAGSGEFLARRMLRKVMLLSRPRMVSLAEVWGATLSEAACAYGLVRLAQSSCPSR